MAKRWEVLVASVAIGFIAASCGSSAPTAAPRTSFPPQTAQIITPSATTRPPTTPPEPPELQSVAFFNPTEGYGAFDVFSPSGSCETAVAKTSDGGSSFGPLVSVDSCDEPSVGDDLAFNPEGDGFLYDPGLQVTHDGGLTWAPGGVPGQVLGVAALGESVWAVAAQCPTDIAKPSDPCPLNVYISDDGGRTWTQTPSEPTGAASRMGSLGSPTQDQSWLVRVSPDSAYLLASPTPPTPDGGATTTVPLWLTTDDGTSWSQRSIQCGIAADSVAFSPTPDGTLYALCAGQPAAGMQMKSLSVSTDGGEDWRFLGPCTAAAASELTWPAACTASPISFGYIGQIDAVSDSTVFAIGPRAPLLETTDGGASWEPVPGSVATDAAHPSQVIFFDPSDGLAVGSITAGTADISHTSDGGRSWSTVPVTAAA